MRLLLLAVFLTTPVLLAGERTVARDVQRNVDAMVLNPTTPSFSGLEGEALVRAYLAHDAQRFGLVAGAKNIRLEKTSETPLGTFYRFRQYYRDIPVELGSITVAVDGDNRIFRVNNEVFPEPKQADELAKFQLSKEDALNVSWDTLRVRGEFQTLPSANRAWMVKDGDFKLIWRVVMPVSEPAGDWWVALDAVTGKVLEVHERAMSRHGERPFDFGDSDETWNNLDVELERITKRVQEREQERRRISGKKNTGQGTIFDLDPRTFLQRDDLLDNDPPETFEPTYVVRPLQELSTDGQGNFQLAGPTAQVVDFELPDTPPSTTPDGNWDFRRGNNAFNDATTYYHVTESIFYVRGLGFNESNNGLPINIDTDAVGGADQSYYSPSADCLYFGHGGVDDNEDPGVIVHEYGHALIDYIAPDLFFDSLHGGGIGEGMSDYMAGSWRYRRHVEGRFWNPAWVFPWDGHNIPFTWRGRFLDAVNTSYNENAFYGPHGFLPGSEFLTDELWSTPLFQALVELHAQGIPIEEVDRAVIQGYYGAGASSRMSSVAEAIVQAAEMLHPDGPHAQVFRNNFARHGILAATPTYTYHSVHVSPASSGWQNEIALFNPNDSAVTVNAAVYQSANDATQTGFAPLSTEDLTLNPGETFNFVPGGQGQRWIRFQSSLPLAGTTVVQRSADGLGTEKATIPLAAETEVSTTVVFPHIPGDRATFFSGGVLLNPNDAAVNLTYELIGTQGNDLTGLLTGNAPLQLEANQKYVSLLAGGLFDDSGSSEQVSWVRITADAPIAGFQLYGYNATGGQLATSGIISQADQVRDFWPIRASLTDSDFNGFSILNPSDADTDATIQILYKDGTTSAEAAFTIPARGKQLGLNNGTFNFPSAGGAVLSEAAGDQIQSVLVKSKAPLRIFELVGTLDGATLDGAAATGPTSRAVFPNVTGTLEVVRLDHAGDVTVTFHGTAVTETRTMAAGATWTATIPEGTTAVEVSGRYVLATVIERSGETQFLATQNGKQIAYIQ